MKNVLFSRVSVSLTQQGWEAAKSSFTHNAGHGRDRSSSTESFCLLENPRNDESPKEKMQVFN